MMKLAIIFLTKKPAPKQGRVCARVTTHIPQVSDKIETIRLFINVQSYVFPVTEEIRQSLLFSALHLGE
jgi:hypothetical protein